MTTVIATNTIDTDLKFSDLSGYTIPASGTVTLTDQFGFAMLVEAEDFLEAVTSGTVSINDGQDDLNVQQALAHISYDTNTGSQSAGQSLLTDGVGSTKYLNINNYRFAFYNSADPFIEEGDSDWVAILTIPFRGSGDSYITEVAAFMSADDDNEDISGEVRLYDKTNLNELGVVSGTNMTTTPVLYSTTVIYNVPISDAVMEVQWRKTTGAPNENVRLYYLEIV